MLVWFSEVFLCFCNKLFLSRVSDLVQNRAHGVLEAIVVLDRIFKWPDAYLFLSI